MKFDLCWNGKSVGSVTVESEGIYQRVQCAYRGITQSLGLFAMVDEKPVYIGLCIPERDTFGITRRIPASRLRGAERFYLAQRNTQSEACVPVSETEVFPALDQLEHARFLMQDKAYLILGQGR